MQALYQLDIQGDELLDRLAKEFIEPEAKDPAVCRLALDWTRGTWEQRAVCDTMISEAVIRWQFSRLSPVDRGILRLAVYQLRFCQEIPPKVVINEAIEMAKKFSTDKSPGFVNGVLDAILRRNDGGDS